MTLLTLQLRTASYKGVRFDVTDAEANAGRRSVLHEYPMRDLPYVEDIGRATRRYALTAIVAGTDYIARTKRLMEALEAPGGGTLVHPWLGSLKVTPTEIGKAKFDRSLGKATIDLVFVETGALENPSGLLGKIESLRKSIDEAMRSVQDAYDTAMEFASVADAVVSAGAQTFGQIQRLVSVNAFMQDSGIAKAVSLVKSGSGSDLKTLGKNLARGLDLSSLTGVSWSRATHSTASLSKSSVLAMESAEGLVAGSSDALIVEQGNAIKSMARSTLAIQAAGAATMVAEDGETSYDELISLQADVCDALDEAALSCPDDELAIVLADLRDSTYMALSESARDSARLIEMDVRPGTPLVVAAYRRYADAERTEEIAKINAVRHYGFSPASGLKALSR